jgi:hypothetical protein
MSIRSRLLGISAAGVMILGLGLPGLAAGAAPDDEAVEVPCWVTDTCVGPGPDDGGGGGIPPGPGDFKQCVEDHDQPGDDCPDHPQDEPEEVPDPGVEAEDAPRRADPNFTG